MRILTKGEGTKLYTPKKDPKPKDQTSQAASIAKKMEEAAVLKALADEAIVITPLLEEQLAKVNRYCTGILSEVEVNNGETEEPEEEGFIESDENAKANDGNGSTADEVGNQQLNAELVVINTAAPTDTMDEPYEEEPFEEEPEEEEIEMEDVALEPTEKEALDLGESVLDDINLDSDEDLLDDEGVGGDASL